MRPRPTQLLDHREFPILYVDDEPANLRIFELTFRREFSILSAESAEEGLRLLNENPVAVVLSDQRMPEVTGVEFLARVREFDPHTIRILVTAYGDVDTLGEAINDGSIYHYTPKPWEPEDMRLTLRRAIEAYALERERGELLGELTLLNRLSRSLHRETNLDRLVGLLLNAAHTELGFDGAALLLFEPGDADRLSWRGLVPANDEVARRLQQVPIARANAPKFIESLCRGEAHTLRVETLAALEGVLRDWILEVSADEILVIPLVGKKRVIGALAVDNRRGGRRFGADDHTLLDGVAVQAAIAIENARLVADLRDSRAQVLRADRLGTLGTLAAGLAHQIHSPLDSIHRFIGRALQKRDDDDFAFWGEDRRRALEELECVRGLVDTISRLARGGTDATDVHEESLDLGKLAGNAVALAQREVSTTGVSLLLDCAAAIPPMIGVREQIEQLMLDLLLNAVQATPADGVVAMKLGPDPERPEDWIELCVEDSGRGIPEDQLERIFDPFFTTKNSNQGTGLGLMIVQRIVADHGGSIEVRSRLGEGACFHVSLPTSGRALCHALDCS